MSFVDINSHLTTKLHHFDIKCQNYSESYDQHSFFGTKFRGGLNFSFTTGGFSNERECSVADFLMSAIKGDGLYKLDRVAPLVASLPHCNYTTLEAIGRSNYRNYPVNASCCIDQLRRRMNE